MASSDPAIMASERLAISNVLERGASEWSARAIGDATTAANAVRLYDTEPMEFILSSNWALSLEGIKDFYEILYKRQENLEMQYDHIIHAFRVKCSSHDEVRIVTLVKGVLDQLVQNEAEKGLETSSKMTSLEDWRKTKFRQGKEPRIPEKYSFPYSVAVCNFGNTWIIPEEFSKEGIMTDRILPERAISKLQQLTSATLVNSSDKRTVYVGASSNEAIIEAKRKLDTLARFCSLLPRDIPQVVEIFFYNEGDRSMKAEYRYVADGNDRLLRSYILDRFDWPHPDRRYTTVFEKGVLIRLNPNNEPWVEAKSLSNTILRLAKEGRHKEEFGGFTLDNWRYTAKGSVIKSPRSISNASTIPSGSTQIAHKQILRPTIESWVSSVPVRNHERPGSEQQTAVPSCKEWLKFAFDEGNVEEPGRQTHGSSKDPLTMHCPFDSNDQDEADSVVTTRSQKPSTLDQSRSSATHGQTSTGRPLPPSFELEPIPSSVPDCGTEPPSLSNIAATSAQNTTEHLTNPRSFADVDTPNRVSHEQPQFNKDCPFELLWKQCRSFHAGTIRRPEENLSRDSETPVPQLIDISEPQVDQINERGSRSFHMTMNQKTGSHKGQREIFPEFDPKMILSISKSLENLIAPLRMWSGVIDLRIDLGRFYFLNVKKSRIQEAGDDDDDKHYPLEDIRTELNKRHRANEKFYFTKVLTTLGAEANDIAHMSDEDGSPMWKRPADCRSSTFEFICRKVLEGIEFSFIVEIDTKTFTHKIKEFKPDQNCFMIYCTKRVWDFRLVLSISQDLDDTYRHFVEDLMGSLRVTPTNDRLPELEVSYNKSYNVEILAVRTRNKACCISEVSIEGTGSVQTNPHKEVQRLYISEVWEMGLLSKGQVEQCIQLKFARYKDNEHTDIPLSWYEASLKSDTFCTAFKENERLEFGDEVKWKLKDLIQKGAVEQLIKKAAGMVKKMDGVGFWNENHQEDLISRIGAGAKAKKGETMEKFW